MWNDTIEKWATTVKRSNAVAVVCPFQTCARGDESARAADEWIVARDVHISPLPGEA